jgi:drug/metabolite transporter (DMT)-like permease
MAAGCLAVFAWGVGPLIVRGLGVDVFAFTLYRMAVAIPVMWLAARLAGERVDAAVMRVCVVPGVLFGGSMLVGFASIRATSIAHATLIGALVPAVVLLGAGRLVGEPTDRSRVPHAVLALVGLALVILTGASSSGASLGGDVLAVINLAMFTLYFLVMKNVRNAGVGSWAFLAGVFVVGTAVVAPVCLLASDDLTSMRSTDWLLVTAMIVGPGLVGHGLMTWASAHLPIATSSLLTLASPVISTLGAWIIYDQRLGWWQVVGAALVLVGLAGVVAGNTRLSARRPPLLS